MPHTWTFTVPAGKSAVFNTRGLTGSPAPIDVEIAAGGEARHFFQVLPGRNEQYRIPPQDKAAEYTLRAATEVAGMSQNLPLDVAAATAGNLTTLTLTGEDFRPTQLSVQVS